MAEEKKPNKKAVSPADGMDERKLKKAVEMVHMSNRFTLSQRKMFDNMLMYSFKNLRTQVEHKASVQQLVKDTGFDSKNIAALRNSLKAIVSQVVELDILNGAGWEAMPLLAGVKVHEGVVTYSYPPKVVELMDNPKVFALISLRLQGEFTTIYGWNLYEQILRFSKVHSTGWITVDKWRKLLGAEDPSYKSFKVFNYTVLKPAIREVQERTPFLLTPEFEKMGRTITKIKFSIYEQEKPGTISVRDTINEADIRTRVMALGVGQADIERAFKDFSVEYIAGNLEIVEKRLRSKTSKVKAENYAAYFAKAIAEDYRPGAVTFDQIVEEERQAEEARAQEEKEAEEGRAAEKKAAISKKHAKAQAYYDSLHEEDKNGVVERFIEEMEAQKQSAILTHYRRSKMESPLVNKPFFVWLSGQIEKHNR